MLRVRIATRTRCTKLCDEVCRRAVGCFFWGTLISPTNKSDHHDITEILLKVALNTIKQANNSIKQDITTTKIVLPKYFAVTKIYASNFNSFLFDKHKT